MTMMRRRRRSGNLGFTMIEALVAVALMGLIVGSLATVTGQWLPTWNRGLVRMQRNEQAAIALERLVVDLSAAEYVFANRSVRGPLFVGEELGVIFVRRAVGPNASPGLEIVRISETADARGRVLVRTRAPFAPLPIGETTLDHVAFGDPVVLVRAPLRVTFAYKREDTGWMSNWRAITWPGAVPPAGGAESSPISLPTAIRFTVRDTVAERVLAVSTATRVHVELAAPAPQNQDQAANPNAAQPAQDNGAGGGLGPRRGGGG